MYGYRSPVVGDKVHYVSPFVPADGSERECLEAEVNFTRSEPSDVDVNLFGVDRNGNEFHVNCVMYRGLSYGYWHSENIRGFQPHSWHYPENDEIRGKDA